MNKHWSSRNMAVPKEEEKKPVVLDTGPRTVSLIDKLLEDNPYSRILADGHVNYHPQFRQAYNISRRLDFNHVIQVLTQNAGWKTALVCNRGGSPVPYEEQMNS